MCELVEANADRRRVISDVLRGFFATTADLHETGALRLPDSVDAATGQLRFCGKTEQPVLEAGRTQVGDEDFHALCSLREPVPACAIIRGRRRRKAGPGYFLKKASSTPFSGRAMTWALTRSPTCLATCAPASTAARTEPTSPRTTVVTYAPPIWTCPTSVMLAALSMASADSIWATSPLVSINPIASFMMNHAISMKVIFVSV